MLESKGRVKFACVDRVQKRQSKVKDILSSLQIVTKPSIQGNSVHMKFWLSAFIALTFSFLTSCSNPVRRPSSDSCYEKRGVMDVGSGSTKAMVAVVNTCQKRIQQILWQDQQAIAFNDDFERSAARELSDVILSEAEVKIRSLFTVMQTHQPVSLSAVATSVFRRASNGQAAADRLSSRLGFPIRVISQEEEAEIGYFSAMAALPQSESSQPLIVWDIGGGSMQMISMGESGRIVFQGNLAAVSFKNRVIEEVQRKDLKTTTSPNPLRKDFSRAVEMATQHASTNVPETIRTISSRAKWVGIGGVLAISLKNQLNNRHIVRGELRQTLQQRAHLSDDQLQGDFRSTEITNLALVLGYMEALHINEIETARVSLNEGLLFRSLQ